MKGKLVVGAALAMFGFAATTSFAQEKEVSTNSQKEFNHVDPRDVMLKRTLWRRVDLKEKQNQPLFSRNYEITKYILEAAKAGLIDAYANDSCSAASKLSVQDLRKKLLIPNQEAGLSQEEIDAGFGAADNGWGTPEKKTTQSDDGWGTPVKEEPETEDDGWGTPVPKKKKKEEQVAVNSTPAAPATPPVDDFSQQMTIPTDEEFFPDQLSVLEIKEDWVFDKKRSRLYNDIQAITIVLPADVNTATGLEIPVASFKYSDLARLFRSDPNKYIWYNAYNMAEHKNLADAFDLRLFHGPIIKTANPRDMSFINMYKGEKEGMMKALQYEQELMELEHGLWEY